MDKEFFLKEVHQYIDDTYASFCHYQDIAKGLLCEFDRICKQNGFQYWLAYGTLLGAVRDHDLIPWDYDIDVFFPADKRADLMAALERDLGPSFTYTYWTNTEHYPTTCLRVCNKNYSWKALHVDVYFLMGTPNIGKERSRFVKKAVSCEKKRIGKYAIEHFPPVNPWRRRVLSIYTKIRYFFTPDRVLNRREEEVLYNTPLGSSDFWMPLGSIHVPLFSKSIFEPEEVMVGDMYLPVPKGYRQMLTQIYGDKWHNYLPVNKRFEEFYEMTKIIEDRQKA